MAEFIKMPTLGFDMEEGTMGQWRKSVGDAVAVGDVLAEIESDKVTQELTSRFAGVLLAQLAQPGQIMLVGSNLGIVGNAGEVVSASGGGQAAPAKAPEATVAPVVEAAAPVAPSPVSADAHSAEFPNGVKATPVARRLAADKGVDLQKVSGTGPSGRIIKADVESFTPAPVSAPVVRTAPTPVVAGPSSTTLPLTKLRKAIARRMTESTQNIPQFYVTTAIDMTDALNLRKQLNAVLPDSDKVSVNDLIVKAVGLALRAYPNLNASFGGDTLIRHNQINVGTAVAVEGGLLTVTQKNTDTSSLVEVARQNKAMIGRAREGKVQGEDISGSTFSVSNLGAFQVDHFIAIVNPPEAAILAVGSADLVPFAKDGQVVLRNVMKATCSADHRITDGAEVAQFLQYLKSILEAPLKLLL